MSDSIRISPKHGLNPTIPICVFCGEQKNEVAILGMLPGDKEAPMSCIIDLNPCEKCQENWQKGVPVIRVSTIPPAKGMPPLVKNNGTPLYPTGAYHVMTPEAVERIFEVKRGFNEPILLDEEVFDKFTEDATAQGAMPETDGGD